MTVETATYIGQLSPTYPTGSDAKSEGDSHLRLIKSVLQAQFTSLGNAPVTATAAQLNALVSASGLLSVGTSTTSNSIGTGSKTFTTQTGLGFAAGQAVRIQDNASLSNYMLGTISSYTTATGALVVSVAYTGGSGTIADWSISLSALSPNIAYRAITSSDTLVPADDGGFVDVTSGTLTLALTAASTLGAFFCYVRNSGTGVVTLDPAGADTIDGASTSLLSPGKAVLLHCDGGSAFRTVAIVDGLAINNSSTASMSADRTLTAGSSRSQVLSSSAVGLCVILPDATTIDVGWQYTIKNTGSLPIGVRSNGNALVGVCDGKKGITVRCLVNTTAAGTWEVDGSGSLPGFVTVDTTYSSTYATTTVPQWVDLDGNKSIHFMYGASNSIYAVCFDSSGHTSGTPLQIESGGTQKVLAAFKISTTTAIVFWEQSTNYRCAVLTVSGTTLTAGTTATTTTNWNPGTDETWIGYAKFVQLSTSLYLVVDNNSTTELCATAVSVSGTTCTIGTRVTSAVTDLVADSTQTFVIDGTNAMVFYRTQAAGPTTPWANRARVVSVSGTVPTFNTAAQVTGVDSTNTTSYTAIEQLTSTLYVIADNNNTSNSVTAAAVSVSGTTVSAGTAITVDSGLTGVVVRNGGLNISNSSRYNKGMTRMSDTTALLGYRQGATSSAQSRLVVLTVSGTNTLTAGSIYQGTVSSDVSSSTQGHGVALPAYPGALLSVAQYYSTLPFAVFIPHAISGSTITQGIAPEQITNMPVFITSLGGVMLPNGLYLINVNLGGPNPSLLVVSTDGNGVAMRGKVALPYNVANNILDFAAPNLTNGTLLRTGTFGQIGSTQLLRMIRVEVVA